MFCMTVRWARACADVLMSADLGCQRLVLWILCLQLVQKLHHGLSPHYVVRAAQLGQQARQGTSYCLTGHPPYTCICCCTLCGVLRRLSNADRLTQASETYTLAIMAYCCAEARSAGV
jgi:hypothetical protein